MLFCLAAGAEFEASVNEDLAWNLWYRSRRVGQLIGNILYGMKCRNIAEPSILSKPCTRVYVPRGGKCPVSGITAGPIHPCLCLPSGVAQIPARVGASSVTSSQEGRVLLSL
ncbi:hypothetical protein LA080_013930 [Diaporthe eres]|nr:hypothetical protein LA080_013930 [Diaporthe eres]